ncbi:hypothetical protein CMI43_03050 [Candidatus Pacearchaeota archaeon]|jgi:hypothetical protein|nr:hypothetical protein [Candidatus Pacearchaeota archaeon]|tara:strand:- start:1249 stop:1455 length:207 start_codon:yes stop_codon:yes gene_type:complete
MELEKFIEMYNEKSPMGFSDSSEDLTRLHEYLTNTDLLDTYSENQLVGIFAAYEVARTSNKMALRKFL